MIYFFIYMLAFEQCMHTIGQFSFLANKKAIKKKTLQKDEMMGYCWFTMPCYHEISLVMIETLQFQPSDTLPQLDLAIPFADHCVGRIITVGRWAGRSPWSWGVLQKSTIISQARKSYPSDRSLLILQLYYFVIKQSECM